MVANSAKIDQHSFFKENERIWVITSLLGSLGYIKKNIRGCVEAKAIVYQSIHFEGGTMFEQLGETKMTVWQPFIPTWMAKSGEPSLGNLKVWMSKRVHYRPLFPKLAKNYSCYEGEYWHWINEWSSFYVTNYINIIHSNVVSVMISVWSCLIFTFVLLKKWNCAAGSHPCLCEWN